MINPLRWLTGHSRTIMTNLFRWLSGHDSDEEDFGLNEYVLPYIRHLKSEYMTLITNLPQTQKDQYDLRTQEAMKLASTIFAKTEKDLMWGDVHTLERIILRLQPLDVVKRRAWSLRDRYHDAVDDKSYMAYERSGPPDPAAAKVDEEELRDDLELLLARFHWMYAIYPLRESARSRITQVVSRQMWVFAIIVFFFVLFDLFGGYHSFVSLFPLILLMGAIGAFISLVQRVQSIPSTGDPILNVLNIKSGRWDFLLAPFSGALFALLAYLLFISGFVNGQLFPSIVDGPKELSPNDPHLSFNWYAHWMMPKSPTDFAKLLIWCFIAGFAERLIPDALNRLVAQKVEGYVVPLSSSLGGQAGAGTETARQDVLTKETHVRETAVSSTTLASRTSAEETTASGLLSAAPNPTVPSPTATPAGLVDRPGSPAAPKTGPPDVAAGHDAAGPT